MGIGDTAPGATTDRRNDNEFTPPQQKPDGSNKSPESQKPDNGSQYSSNDPQMSTQPYKPSNGNHYPPNEPISNEANKPHNGIQGTSDDPNMLPIPKKPRNGSETSDESNKQNNQQCPTVTTSEMNPKKVTTEETPDLAQSKQTHGNPSSGGAGDTEQPGSNGCCCCSIL